MSKLTILLPLLFLVACSGSAEKAKPSTEAAGDAGVRDAATDSRAAGDARRDAAGIATDTGTTSTDIREDRGPMVCVAAGQNCDGSVPCCSGSSCVGGSCVQPNNCVWAGDFCTRQTASRCCSGRCDGDSCLGELGDPCDGRGCINSTSCVDSTCQCLPNERVCGASCVDTMTSFFNCGACGVRCGPDQTCTNGDCECQDSSLIKCALECVSTSSDEAHCGRCDNVCAADRQCRSGQCECVAPEIDCFGTCLNPIADANNCGTCGNSCASDEMCSNRQCVCATGLTLCPNGVCTDLMNDSTNCGLCGELCRGNKTCVVGTCQ